MHIYVYMCMYIYVYMHLYMHICINIYAYIYIGLGLNFNPISPFIHAYMYIYICIYFIYIYIYIWGAPLQSSRRSLSYRTESRGRSGKPICRPRSANEKWKKKRSQKVSIKLARAVPSRIGSDPKLRPWRSSTQSLSCHRALRFACCRSRCRVFH